MLKEILLSVAPFAYPAACFSAGCTCEWLCNSLGAAGCVGIAAAGAAALFASLALVNQLRSLDAVRN